MGNKPGGGETALDPSPDASLTRVRPGRLAGRDGGDSQGTGEAYVGDENGKDDQRSSDDEGGSILDDGGVDTDERAGRSLGIEPDKEPDDETKQDMEEERERRLDPDNRPDNVEIDNTDRTFDADRGMFTDNDEYDESADAPFTDPEDPNSEASASGDESDDKSDDGKSDDESNDGESEDSANSEEDEDPDEDPDEDSGEGDS